MGEYRYESSWYGPGTKHYPFPSVHSYNLQVSLESFACLYLSCDLHFDYTVLLELRRKGNAEHEDEEIVEGVCAFQVHRT